MANDKKNMRTGKHDGYLWLTIEQRDLETLVRMCPLPFLGKYVAVISRDSGPFVLDDEDRRSGWESVGEISYSSQIGSTDVLPQSICAGFDEWYVFESPTRLGQIADGNVFESILARGQVFPFVHFLDFALHNPDMRALTDLFWKQLGLIQPESYIAHGDWLLTVVTRNEDVFRNVKEFLSDPSS